MQHNQKNLTRIYLAYGEFNISQFKLRQSLRLYRHNLDIEFGILQNNHFIRFKTGNHILNEICSPLNPSLTTENILASDNIRERTSLSSDFDSFRYVFEGIYTESINSKLVTSLRAKTNDEGVYKLTHSFKGEHGYDGDYLELYLDVKDGITLHTLRTNTSSSSMLHTESTLILPNY
jgi:hypothetical protein